MPAAIRVMPEQVIWVAMPKGDGGEEPAWGQVRLFFYMPLTPSKVHGRRALSLTSHTTYGPRSAPVDPSAQTCMRSRLLKP